MIFLPLEDAELGRLEPLLVRDPASALTAEGFHARMSAGEYRPEWIWVAEHEHGDEPAGAGPPAMAAIWWGPAEEKKPAALDALYARGADRARAASALLAAAHAAFARAGLRTPPDYHIFLPADWRDRPEVPDALAWRLDAARRAGLTGQLERSRYEWTPDGGMPAPSGRLTFRPEPDDEVFVGLFSRALTGTLDATSRKEAEASGARTQASQDVAFYRDHMVGQRSWWRVAETPAGEVAGFGIPSRNSDVPVVGYLGVLPDHRGRGYVNDILAEITRILVAEAGATKIHADTDLKNRPMSAAFERCGYRVIGRRIVMSAR